MQSKRPKFETNGMHAGHMLRTCWMNVVSRLDACCVHVAWMFCAG